MNGDGVGRTRPPGKEDSLLRERFSDAVADQSRLMDSFAQTLFMVELAVPGLHGTVLKLVSGKESLALTHALYFAFVCWLIALAATLYSVIPKAYKVNPEHLRNSSDSIETFFYASARHKWRLLIASVAFFVAGVCAGYCGISCYEAAAQISLLEL